MQKVLWRLVLLTIALFLVNCEGKVTINYRLPVSLQHPSTLVIVKRMTGADSIYALQSTYEDSVEKFHVEVNIINPTQLSTLNDASFTTITDSILRIIGYELFPDSMTVHYIINNTSFLFSSEYKITKTYNSDYIIDRFHKIFADEIKMDLKLDSLIPDWPDIRIITDSLLMQNSRNYTAMLYKAIRIIGENADCADKALNIIQPYLKIAPYNNELNYYAGVFHFNNSDYNAAITYLEKSIKHTPKNESILYLIGKAYYAAGENTKSKSYFLRAKQSGSEAADSMLRVLYNKGY